MSKNEAKTTKSISELRQELAEARRAHRMGELKNTARLQQLRHDIARAITAERQNSEKKVEEK